MKQTTTFLISFLCFQAATSFWAHAQSSQQSRTVDSLFAKWNKSDSPGCVCGVIQDQKLIYAKGYGMADLEHDVPITPASVFYIASTSKQFTAASIALLALDKKLSLDDDIHIYLPDIPSYGKPITINNLLHHTSGLRDHFGLMELAGWHESDYINNEMALRLVAQQRGLEFESGTKHEYSNTNYMLLAEIVRKVSGKSLREFAQERIFTPLSMTHTHFDDNYPQVVKQRVISYSPSTDGSYIQLLKDFDLHGDGNLLTTVEDLQRWDANFYTGQVGGKALINLLLTKGVLANKDTIPYALGLSHGKYKGLPTVSHTGGFKGFRTQLIRFPEQQFSVAVLCNLGTISPYSLANRVADIYLSDRFTQANATKPKETTTTKTIAFDSTKFKPCAGKYELAPGVLVSFWQEGNRYYTQVSGQSKLEMFPSSDSTFFLQQVEAKITFHRQANGQVNKITFHQNGDHSGDRVVAYSLPAGQLNQYAGIYTSAELNNSYRFVVEKDTLLVRHHRLGNVGSCSATGKDQFDWNGYKLEFVRSDAGKITGYRIPQGFMHGIVFEKR